MVPFALEAEEPIKRGAAFSLEEEFRRQLRKIDRWTTMQLLRTERDIDKKQKKWARKFYEELFDGRFIPGGRVLAGAGALYRLKTLANCFVTKIQRDDIDSIYKAAYECARTYSYGGGIGVDISSLRPKDSIVHNAADSSTGAVSFMELYSLTTGLIGQSGRRGALMLTIDVKHPDIEHFLKVKKFLIGLPIKLLINVTGLDILIIKS